ncbi:hypothetical protein ALI22I_16955 [Saccharothrix sp. ALI-22-I]|uniref:DUF4386 domain-containing protein n=1 Tax=Saccharothrix sp. ALI-22-I TaxID=1933778 RepID=UPI00097BA862|nr:DUF4386 domain-containing protein [Saccharothrix sp. ALI-22-I]ONI89191.1 hypothetical protein ALI22I_16955 [Saccharothrix sp. ALI-22-I]
MSSRAIGRAVGALFLLAFVVYIAGEALIGVSEVGALLMLVDSAVVAAIGVLVFPVLKPHDEVTAHAYLIGRAVEAVMLAVGVVFLLLLMPLGNHYSYQIAMMSVGTVGVLFCRVLFRARLVPRFLAVWGMAGYAVFLVGAALEVLGYGVGVALSVPGGLFEIALGVLLIVKGFPAHAAPLTHPAAQLSTSRT